MDGDSFLDVLFRIRGHYTELIASVDPDLDQDADRLPELQAQFDRVNAAINKMVADGFTSATSVVAEASSQLAAVNQELVAAKQRNDKIKSGIAIAAKVLQVVAGVASLA